ncbi:MAG: hypothetical protein EA382_10470 [Spirochaetaceae bacterium]|nr:MAG: hypothetical protein EA382_10470 [Spirochaetaceae bacterium]
MLRPRAIALFITVLALQGATRVAASDWEWRFIAGGATVGAGAVAPDGVYYFAAADRFLYAIDSAGRMIWRTDLNRRPVGGVAIGPDRSIYTLLEGGELVALNRDGRLLWRAATAASRFFPAVTATGMIVIADPVGGLSARTHRGREVWRVTLDSAIVAPPIIAFDGRIVVATSDGYLRRYSTDGRPIDAQFIGEVVTALASGRSLIVAGSAAGRVVAVDAALAPVWRVDAGSAVRGMSVTDSDDVWVTTDDAQAIMVRHDGGVGSRLVLVAPAVGGPVVGRMGDAAAVMLAGQGGRLVAHAADGGALWSARVSDRVESLTVDPRGTLIVTTANWVTYAFETGFTPAGVWQQHRGDARRRGAAVSAPVGRTIEPDRRRTADYLLLRSYLTRPDSAGQTVAMSEIRDRVTSGRSLDGSYGYLLEVAETAAGAPFFGPTGQTGSVTVARSARQRALEVIGAIGDLESVRFLGRLLERENDPAMQASILGAISALGGGLDDALATRLYQIIRRDASAGASDASARVVMSAIDALDRYHGRYLSPIVADVLLAIAQGGYGRAVRVDALDLLRRLGGGS